MRFAICILFLSIFGCNTGASPANEDIAIKEQERSAMEQAYATTDFNGCYWKISGRDTIVAWLAQTENTLTGKLSFDNFEKDGSSGTVHGTIEGDTARLWYSFESEGMKSVMEIRFRKNGDRLLRGTGVTQVNGDTSLFSDNQPVEFNEDFALVKTDCGQVPGKYK
jgi:hypothetical protein